MFESARNHYLQKVKDLSKPVFNQHLKSNIYFYKIPSKSNYDCDFTYNS